MSVVDDNSPALAAELEQERARLEQATAILGHTFARPALLLRALTHKSLVNERASAVGHNEVLELLGDAVLSLVTMETLLRQTPDAHEGELTDRRARHVKEETLAVRAAELGLVELLRTGRSFDVAIPISARADLVEALLGAVYEDAGLDAARRAALKMLGEPPREAPAAASHAKKVLQERLQRLFGEPPAYDVERTDGPNHAPVFKATATFRGVKLGEGQGTSKRGATQAAALDAVARLEVDDASLRERLSAHTQPADERE